MQLRCTFTLYPVVAIATPTPRGSRFGRSTRQSGAFVRRIYTLHHETDHGLELGPVLPSWVKTFRATVNPQFIKCHELELCVMGKAVTI